MKHAIVTGAGGDIGACITELAVSRGYRVVAVDVRPNQIDALAYRLDGVVPIVADITDPDSVKKAFDVFDSPLDLLVNNAGLVRFGPLESLAVKDFQDVVNVNLVGSFIVAREAAVRMKATGGGAIVNVTSMGGIHPAPGGGAYGASKAGLAQMT